MTLQSCRAFALSLGLSLPLLLAVPASGLAAGDHDAHAGHGDHTGMPAATPAALADGVVRKVDKAGGRLTVAHGPLPNGMPAMTMAFRVKDAAWLDQLKEGQKIRFATETSGAVTTIVRVEAVK